MPNVGRYRVVRRIGRGGMAEVLEAIAVGDSNFERRVAIKRLLPGAEAQPSLGRMFLDEARIASRLHHGNIVSVVDYGIADGLPFQVLEYVDGADAAELCRRGIDAGDPMPVAVALYICSEVAHALAYAHDARDADGRSMGIVHRDVKPPNILVSWSGDVRLADFGIALARERTETTSAGVAKGTLLYMAPEQATRGEIDARADVFSLGCVLHSLVAGDSPLAGDDTVMSMLAGAELSVGPELPDDIAAIVTRSVRRAKSDRYGGAEQMGDELGAALARRIDRDAKAITRAWLERLRPRALAAPGKLDALFDLDLVLAHEDHDVREFATVTPTAVTVAAKPESRPRRRPFVAALALVLIVSGVAGAWALLRTSADDATVVVATTPVDAGSPPPPDASLVVRTAPMPPPAHDAAPPADARRRTRRADRRFRPDASSVARTPPARLDASTSGFLSIGGARAHRAKILVDGNSQGYAPRKIELAAGTHRVELIGAGGEVIDTRTVRISDRHTENVPFRWILSGD